jgi:hypothetical protein
MAGVAQLTRTVERAARFLLVPAQVELLLDQLLYPHPLSRFLLTEPVVVPLDRHVLVALSALVVLSTVIVEQVKCIAQPIPVNRLSVLVTLLLRSDQHPRETCVRCHLRPSNARQVNRNR